MHLSKIIITLMQVTHCLFTVVHHDHIIIKFSSNSGRPKNTDTD